MATGRKPHRITPPAEAPRLNETALATLDAAPVQLAAMQAAYGQERDLLNQLLGQAQMADAFAKFSGTVTTSKLAYVKENKLYRALKGQENPARDGFLSGTWDEFCGLLGRSSEHADRDIANLRAFGEEALESMSRMGIGYRELRQYRRLPEDQKQALIDAAKAGDKEGFVELAEEIITRHAKEKEALQAELQDARDQTEDMAAGKRLVESTVADLRKQARRLAQATPDEVTAALRQQAEDVAATVEATIYGTLRDGVEQLMAHGEEIGRPQHEWVEGLLRQVFSQLTTVAGRNGMELVDEAPPAGLTAAAIPATPDPAKH